MKWIVKQACRAYSTECSDEGGTKNIKEDKKELEPRIIRWKDERMWRRWKQSWRVELGVMMLLLGGSIAAIVREVAAVYSHSIRRWGGGEN